VGSIRIGDDSLPRLADLKPEVVIVELTTVEAPAWEFFAILPTLRCRGTVVVLEEVGDPWALERLLHLGVNAVLGYPPTQHDLERALRSAVEGRLFMSLRVRRAYVQPRPIRSAPSATPSVPLTPREGAILGLVAQGLSQKQIAAKLAVSVNTVRNHLAMARAKFEAHSAIDLLNRARHTFALTDASSSSPS
jgi:DNA-binding NarL/FixJ family response regulator